MTTNRYHRTHELPEQRAVREESELCARHDFRTRAGKLARRERTAAFFGQTLAEADDAIRRAIGGQS